MPIYLPLSACGSASQTIRSESGSELLRGSEAGKVSSRPWSSLLRSLSDLTACFGSTAYLSRGAGLNFSGMIILPFRRANGASDLWFRTSRTDAIRIGCPNAMAREVSLVKRTGSYRRDSDPNASEPGPRILLILIVSVVSQLRPHEICNAFSYAMLQQSSFAVLLRGPQGGSAWVTALRR